MRSRGGSPARPPYVVVSALVVAVTCGPWLWRILAVADMLIVPFIRRPAHSRWCTHTAGST